MSLQNFVFNYDDFYAYYTDPNNVIRDESDCVKLYFYNSESAKPKPVKISEAKCTYIVVNGTKIYISKDKKIQNNYTDENGKTITEINRGLHFSIPTFIDDVPFDFHYHIGKKTITKYEQIKHKKYIKHKQNEGTKNNRTPNNKTSKNAQIKKKPTPKYYLQEVVPEINNYPIVPEEKIIYFHKTVHHVDIHDSERNGRREHLNCYFQDNTMIEDINDIVCLDKNEHTMGSRFDETDKSFINQILRKPFYNEMRGGKRNHAKTMTTRKKLSHSNKLKNISYQNNHVS